MIISHKLRRTSIVTRKQREALKIHSKELEKKPWRNCAQHYRMILKEWDIILDDGKCFGFSDNDVQSNQRHYIWLTYLQTHLMLNTKGKNIC